MSESRKHARLTFTVEGCFEGVGGYLTAPSSFECPDPELVRFVARAVQLFAERRREEYEKPGMHTIGHPPQITGVRVTECETTSTVTAYDAEIASHPGSSPAPHDPASAGGAGH